MNTSTIKLTVILGMIISTLMLSGCGFHLRGAQEMPAQYKTTSFFGVAEFSPLGKVLRQYLSSAGLQYETESSQSDLVLVVKKDEFTRRVLSVNSSGAANEYELTYRLVMLANNAQGKKLTSPIKIELIRNYIFDPNNILGKSAEEERVKTQMQQLAVRQALRQLGTRLQRVESAAENESPAKTGTDGEPKADPDVDPEVAPEVDQQQTTP